MWMQGITIHNDIIHTVLHRLLLAWVYRHLLLWAYRPLLLWG